MPESFGYRAYLDPTRTTSSERPRRRRRFNVLRPAFVAMRARKPCLLRRLRFRGLYVGFMVLLARYFGVQIFGVEQRKLEARTRSGQRPSRRLSSPRVTTRFPLRPKGVSLFILFDFRLCRQIVFTPFPFLCGRTSPGRCRPLEQDPRTSSAFAARANVPHVAF